MNIAIIFAGGVGKRMNNSNIPKQFLKVNDKEILAYTIDKFQKNELIDEIILVVLKNYIDLSNTICDKYKFFKVKNIVSGGQTGQDSIYNGLIKAKELYDEKSIVLINDGVRPMITDNDINSAINLTKNKGNAIPVTKAIDTIAINSKNGELGEIVKRDLVLYAKAPQTFVLKDILSVHERAKVDKLCFIDSASMMQHYGYKLYTFECGEDNIKITTPIDYSIFKGLIETKKNAD